MPDPGEPAGFNHLDFPPAPPARVLQTGPAVRAWLAAELATVRAELGRVDAKANTLFAVCGVLVAAGVSVLSKSGLPAAAAVIGWTATTLVAAAVMLLLFAIRPNLTGSFGFVRWACASDGQDLLDILTRDGADAMASDAEALHRLSVMLRGKYQAIRHASTLLLAGLGAAAITAVLAVWAR